MVQYFNLFPREMDTSTPVLVLAYGLGFTGAGYGPLGVARTLGRLGIPVYVVRDKRLAPMPASRFWKRTFTWNPAASGEELLRLIMDIGGTLGGRPVLLSTTDRGARFIAGHADRLAEAFTFSAISPALMEALTNKWQMHFLAKQHGVPTPETSFPRSRDDVLRFLAGARFPIVLKGADPLLPSGRAKEIVHNTRDLLEKYDHAASAGPANLMLQEYIPGDDDTVWMCNAYLDRQSRCLAAFTGRKIRQWPAYAGVASLAICQGNPTVEDATKRFLQAVGYRGLVGIGFRYDARDGLYKILDVNPRVSAIFRLFLTVNGLDPVRISYLDLTGQAIPPSVAPYGRKWMLEDDLSTMLRYRSDGKLTVRQWLRSLRGVRETAWFAPDDPLPFLVWCWGRLLKVAERSPRGQPETGRNTGRLSEPAR